MNYKGKTTQAIENCGENSISKALPMIASSGNELADIIYHHAIQSSTLASQLASAEATILDLLFNNAVQQPSAALELLSRFERIRRSASADIRASYMALQSRPAQVAIAQVVIPPQMAITPRRQIQPR
jgi:hypothetical protein